MPHPSNLGKYRTIFIVALLVVGAISGLWSVMGWPPLLQMFKPGPSVIPVEPLIPVQPTTSPARQPDSSP